MVDLTKLLQLSKSGITRLVDRLEEAGFVARKSSPTDRRLTYASLTEQGREVLDRYEPVFAAAVEEHFSKHLAPADLIALETALRQLLDGNRTWDDARLAPIYEERPAEVPPGAEEPVVPPLDTAA
jgi:DNA-binding MarR family transcriptional regulator